MCLYTYICIYRGDSILLVIVCVCVEVSGAEAHRRNLQSTEHTCASVPIAMACASREVVTMSSSRWAEKKSTTMRGDLRTVLLMLLLNSLSFFLLFSSCFGCSL